MEETAEAREAREEVLVDFVTGDSISTHVIGLRYEGDVREI